jgi:hypothetical protein
MGMSCSKENIVYDDAECSKLPTVVTFKDEAARVVWHTNDYPNIEGVTFTNLIGSWNAYRICSLPKELQINDLKIRCSGRTVKTSNECGPNVKGCNMNSVIVESYVIVETPVQK